MRELKRKEMKELVARVFNMSKEEVRQLVMYHYYGRYVEENRQKLERIKEFFRTHKGENVKIISHYQNSKVSMTCKIINVYPDIVLLQPVGKERKFTISFADLISKDYSFEEVGQNAVVGCVGE